MKWSKWDIVLLCIFWATNSFALLLYLRMCNSTGCYCMDIRMFRVLLTNACHIFPSYICKLLCLSPFWALFNAFGKRSLASSFLVSPSIRMKNLGLSQEGYSWNFSLEGLYWKLSTKLMFRWNKKNVMRRLHEELYMLTSVLVNRLTMVVIGTNR